MPKVYSRVLRDVSEELDRVIRKPGGMTYRQCKDPHLAYAVILEELEELWKEVRRRPNKRRPKRMKAEAVQVAVAAIGFAMEVCDR